jgi:hypothetical protein
MTPPGRKSAPERASRGVCCVLRSTGGVWLSSKRHAEPVLGPLLLRVRRVRSGPGSAGGVFKRELLDQTPRKTTRTTLPDRTTLVRLGAIASSSTAISSTHPSLTSGRAGST